MHRCKQAAEFLSPHASRYLAKRTYRSFFLEGDELALMMRKLLLITPLKFA